MGPGRRVSEASLREQLVREGLRPTRWSNGPGAVYETHEHPYQKILVVADGSITFTIQAGKHVVRMKTGDRLVLPSRTAHSAHVGPDGVVCLEAQVEESPGVP